MSFKPCIVIPCYEHGAALAATVERLRPYGLPIVVVDDGSGPATRAALDALAAGDATVQVLHRPSNGGKGAAVLDGLRAAAAQGHSHALQIDADGQHDCADVPALLAAAAQAPTAMICGEPCFGADMPRGRRYGRYLTHVWVWIETLSFDIRDAMCGFRVYPLAATVALADRVHLPPRMDFDVEVLVRLYWAGLPFVWHPTRVVYPVGGRSHFRLWRDNLRLSAMHTRLVLGMLLRLPRLLWWRLAGRPQAQASAARGWAALAERGSAWGLRLVAVTYRLAGRRLARWVLWPAVLYFFATGTRARAASRDYLRRLHGFAGAATPAPTAANILRHMLSFAEAGLDKLAAWGGELDETDWDFPARAAFRELAASGRGALLLGAHLGSLEVARALGTRGDVVKFTAIVYTRHAQRFAAALAQADPRAALDVIQVDELTVERAIDLRARIERGEFLVMVGDRTPPSGNSRTVAADFLGAPALFPQGPYILAHLLECPVYLFLCVRGREHFHVVFEPFAQRIELPRGARQSALAQYAQRYADAVQTQCAAYPLQWFNFYDFWQTPGAGR